jgi:hypothetical protein
MPEAAVHEDGNPESRERDVGCSPKLQHRVMDSEPKPPLMKE